ncbi:hypothetical protein [Burkholderia sp. F1]|uniref:hypothetical protein n=1 Tax=Burkholderia sp. F1 TaxID=3366817 RepID=UPI003D71250F
MEPVFPQVPFSSSVTARHIASVIWAACVMGYGLRNLTVIAFKLSEKTTVHRIGAGRLAQLEERYET